MKKIIILLILFIYSASLSSQVIPIDTIQNTLDKLKTELNANYFLYNPKYKTPGVALTSITCYEYNTDNKLIIEKSIAENDNYSINYYKDGSVVKSISTLLGHKKLVLKKYDKDNRLVEKKEYSDYFPDHEDKEVYSSENIKSHSKDTITTKVYVNGNLTGTYVYKYKEEKLIERDVYRSSVVRPDSKCTYTYTADNKHIAKEIDIDHVYKYDKELTNTYNKQGLLEKSIETNAAKTKNKKTLYYYNEKKLLTKEEEFESDSLSITRHYEYDANEHRVSEKAYDRIGTMIYQCLYEYDDKGNKTVYLYFYRGR